MDRKVVAAGIVVILSSVLASGILGHAAAQTVYDLDKDTALTQPSTINEFESDGVVTVSVGAPDMDITVSESGDSVGAGMLYSDLGNTFVQVDYDETISRTVRFYIPKEYFYPVTKDGMESIDGETKSDMRGVESNAYTSFTVYLDGETNATFAIGKQAGVAFRMINNTKTRADEIFGIEIPSIGVFGGGEDWKYIEADHFGDNQSTYAISHGKNETILLQYDESGPTEPETWVPVPECNSKPVCRFSKTGVEDGTFLLVQTDTPPAIRYKPKTGPISGTSGFWNDLKQIPGRVLDDIFGAF